MKIIYLIIAGLLIVTAACNKSQPESKTYQVIVKEYKTGLPLQGAKFELLKCTYYDAADECNDTAILATYTTDLNGETTVDETKLGASDAGCRIWKTQYFTIEGGGSGRGENFMEPEAWVNINLKAGKSYPDTLLFEITTSSELSNISSLTFIPPKDSTIRFRLFGNETNHVYWAVATKPVPCYANCPPSDTIALGSIILNPEKFEHLDTSIVY